MHAVACNEGPGAEFEYARLNLKNTRIALYSHDTMGLGHMRRNLLIAHTLASSHFQPVILMIVGKTEARRFPLPPRADRIVLPALRKTEAGQYEARSLGVPLQDLIAIRSAAISGALEAFQPDLVIIDNVPRGAVRELDATLSRLSRSGRTRFVLGLRDVLDDPQAVAREWAAADNVNAIRNFYDGVWIYGDARFFDVVSEYRFPADVADRTTYTGYFDQRIRLQYTPAEEYTLFDRLRLPDGPVVLCLLGGGQDGGSLAKAFSAAVFPGDWNAVIVTGPYLPQRIVREVRERESRDARFRVLDFISEPAVLISRADRIVGMGGYNTVWEILSQGKPSLIVPRVRPRVEQLMRARKLESLGLLDVLQPDQLSAEAISCWVASSDVPNRVQTHDAVDMTGLTTIPDLALQLLNREPLSLRKVS